MKTSTAWQLGLEAAERYENILMPAILGPFAKLLVDLARLRPGDQVVDIGCGTGAGTRYAAETVGSIGRVIGLDKNQAMISVAQSIPSGEGAEIEWRVGDATSLPFDDDSFDVVVCAQSLQFMPQKLAALAEMRRIIRVRGRVILSVWTPLSDNPYFNSLVQAIGRHIGAGTAAGLGSAFSLSNQNEIEALLKMADFQQIDIRVGQLNLPFDDLAKFIPRHISATPMWAGFNQGSEAVQETVVQEVIDEMAPYMQDGRAEIPFHSFLIVAKA